MRARCRFFNKRTQHNRHRNESLAQHTRGVGVSKSIDVNCDAALEYYEMGANLRR